MVLFKKSFYKNFLVFLFLSFPFQALSNVRGTDIQNFNPTYNGLDFVTVHSGATLKPYELNVGWFVNYATNSLPYSTISTNPNPQKFGDPNDSHIYSNFQIGIGILSNWDFGLSIGSVMSEKIDGRADDFAFYYEEEGLNDILLSSKIRFFENKTFRLALVGGIDFDQIERNPFSGQDPGPAVSFEFVGDVQIKPDLLLAVNVGYRLRDKGLQISNSGIIPMTDQITYSSALSFKTDGEGSAVIGEIYGSLPTEEKEMSTDREMSNLEFLAGYRFNGVKDLNFHGGVGTRFFNGIGSPDMRVYIGLNWQIDKIAQAVGFKSGADHNLPVRPPQELEKKAVDGKLEGAEEKPDKENKAILDEIDSARKKTENLEKKSPEQPMIKTPPPQEEIIFPSEDDVMPEEPDPFAEDY